MSKNARGIITWNKQRKSLKHSLNLKLFQDGLYNTIITMLCTLTKGEPMPGCI